MTDTDKAIAALTGRVYGLEVALTNAWAYILSSGIADPLMAGEKATQADRLAEALIALSKSGSPVAGPTGELRAIASEQEAETLRRVFAGPSAFLTDVAKVSLDLAKPESESKN